MRRTEGREVRELKGLYRANLKGISNTAAHSLLIQGIGRSHWNSLTDKMIICAFSLFCFVSPSPLLRSDVQSRGSGKSALMPFQKAYYSVQQGVTCQGRFHGARDVRMSSSAPGELQHYDRRRGAGGIKQENERLRQLLDTKASMLVHFATISRTRRLVQNHRHQSR